jgi:hypothetical protein
MVMKLLCGIRDANRQVVRRRLLERVEQAGLATPTSRSQKRSRLLSL